MPSNDLGDQDRKEPVKEGTRSIKQLPPLHHAPANGYCAFLISDPGFSAFQNEFNNSNCPGSLQTFNAKLVWLLGLNSRQVLNLSSTKTATAQQNPL